MTIVYLNGEFIPQADAKISIMDRGFLFGDGVYEVVPVFDGKMLGLDEHLQRLKRSLAAIQLSPPLTDKQWKSVFKELLARNNKMQGDQNIYLQITRGAAETRIHAFPEHVTPTVVAFCTPSKTNPPDVVNTGFSAITLEDTRRRDCYIKAITLLPNILLYEQAKEAGAVEAILIRNGTALEGTSSNLFVVKDNQLLTPPLSKQILGGITRNLIIKLAKHHKIPFKEMEITEALLLDADEIWLTGSSKEIYPIVTLDNKPVGNGKVGPICQKMLSYYHNHKEKVKKSND